MKIFSSSTPVRLPLTFADPAEGVALVGENERDFDARLNAAAEAICADCVAHGVKVIRLSGPTCAGKTTTADKLTAVLEAAGRVVYPISIDDFFYGRDVLEAMAESRPDGKLDYDSVAAIDLPALAACVRDLMEKGSAKIPIFDFVTGYTEGYRELTVAEDEEPIFLFEGIQAVYPEVAALFAGIPERSIFINVMKETVLVSPDGKFEYEAAHGTVTQHYYRYLKGEQTSTNPMATIFAWSGALRKRGEMDGLEDLQAFGDKLEEACIDTLNDGIMTKDLVGLVSEGYEAHAVNSIGFIKAIRERLEAKLA